MYIDGKWVEAGTGKSFTVRNPATGEVIASVPDADARDTEKAIEAAYDAFPSWSKLPAKDRADLLLRVRDLMLGRSEELARLIAMEEGKPIRESRAEIGYSAEFIKYFAEESKRSLGRNIHLTSPRQAFLCYKAARGGSRNNHDLELPVGGDHEACNTRPGCRLHGRRKTPRADAPIGDRHIRIIRGSRNPVRASLTS